MDNSLRLYFHQLGAPHIYNVHFQLRKQLGTILLPLAEHQQIKSASQVVWYHTNLPHEVLGLLESSDYMAMAVVRAAVMHCHMEELDTVLALQVTNIPLVIPETLDCHKKKGRIFKSLAF